MNPILQNVVDSVEQIATDPQSKEQFDRIVMAGKKIMFDKATHDKLSWLQEPSDLAVLVNGVFDLITIITELSKNTAQQDPLHGAAVVLTMEALEFASRLNEIEITPEIAQAAVQAIDERMSEMNSGTQSAAPQVQQEPSQPKGLIDPKGGM